MCFPALLRVNQARLGTFKATIRSSSDKNTRLLKKTENTNFGKRQWLWFELMDCSKAKDTPKKS